MLLLIVLVIVLWGMAPLISKKIYGSGINTITSMIFSTTFYLIIILCVACYNSEIVLQDIQTKVNKELILLIFCYSLFFMFLSNYTNNYLIRNNNASYITSMTSIYPVVTLLVSYLYFKEELSTKKLVGVLSIIGGIYCLN